MSKASTKNTQLLAPQGATSSAKSQLEKYMSVKQAKRLASEDDSLVVSDSVVQVGEVSAAASAAPVLIDAPVVLAQANTTASVSGGTTTVEPVATSTFSSALNSGWALGAAAVGAVAVAAHNTPAGAAAATATNAVATGGIVAGPVLASNDLVVHLYAADGTTQIGTATVNGTGQYTAELGNYTGVVIAKVSSSGAGADYLDEATGQAVDLGSHVLTAVGVASATGLTLSINPLTTIAAQMAGVGADGSVSGSITATDVQSANETVAAAFGIQGSLIAPTALTAVIDVHGVANSQADAYGKVLAVLSGLDEINGGDLQAAIHTFAADLTSNNGQLSATSKFSLVVAAQDAQLIGVSSGLASTISSLAQIEANDIQEVISSGRTNFSDNELASALSSVLDTAEPIRIEDIDAVIASITAANGVTDLQSLTQAAGHYVAMSSGVGVNLIEARAGVALYLQGLGLAEGDSVSVSIQDPNAINDHGVLELGNFSVGADGHTVVLPDLWPLLWTGDTATENNGAPLSLTVTHNGSSLSGTFEVDMYAPSEMGRWSLNAEPTGYWSGYTNGSNSSIVIQEPRGWIQGDHWQYKIGSEGSWVDGHDFVNNQATLSLSDGVYGTSTDNKIYLRTYDDAGNFTAAVASNAQFTLDSAAPTAIVNEDGSVTMNELGKVVLIDDAILSPSNSGALISVLDGAVTSHQAAVAEFWSQEVVDTSMSMPLSGLQYGSYHYYAVDYAGNVASLQSGTSVTIDSRAPVVNTNAVIADKTIYLDQNLNITIDSGQIFHDPDNNALNYSVALLDANGVIVPIANDWLMLTKVDDWTLTLTATASDVAANMSAGPLRVQITATDSAGLTEKSVSDEFTLTYVPEVFNNPPALDWTIGSWDVNVGADSNGNFQTYDLTSAYDLDNDPLTYTATMNGDPLPAWLTLNTNSYGTKYLMATPLTENGGQTYQVTVTATDTHGASVSDTFDLNVNSDTGSVFYPGQSLTAFNLALSNDALSGSAVLADGSTIDLSTSQYFFGGSALTDAANVQLDNTNGSSIASGGAPSLALGNFNQVNIDVISHTELNNLETWRISQPNNLPSQDVNIHAYGDLIVDYMSTASFADTTLLFNQTGNVTLNCLDATYAIHDSTGAYVSSPMLNLFAQNLVGNLNVGFYAAAAEVTGGGGNDTLAFFGGNRNDADPTAQIKLWGGSGADTFKIAGAHNAHVTVMDYLSSEDNLLDLSAVTNNNYAMRSTVDVAEAPTLDSVFNQGGGAAIDVLGVQNGANFDIYVDVDHDDRFTSNDVVVTLQNFTLGSASMDALVTHIV